MLMSIFSTHSSKLIEKKQRHVFVICFVCAFFHVNCANATTVRIINVDSIRGVIWPRAQRVSSFYLLSDYEREEQSQNRDTRFFVINAKKA
jgi:hypothetical protein